MTARLFPAIDIQPFAPPAHPEELQGAILAALDDGAVTAIVELPLGWRFFFSTAEARDRAGDVLAERWPESLSLAAVDVSDEDWARRSQESLGPVQVGRVRIAPPWASAGDVRLQPDATIEVVLRNGRMLRVGAGADAAAVARLAAALEA